jgi:excisionase family DNA binding protein
MITVEEAASHLHISPEECRRWIHAGVLPGVKVGQRWMMKKTDLSRAWPAASARNPRNWLDHALTLMQAAKHLWPTAEGTAPSGGDTGTSAVGLMLAGRALEVLTKGLLIANNPALVSNDGLMKRIENLELNHFPTHELDKLLQATGLALDPEEADLVTRLMIFSKWAGCYPSDTRWTPLAPAAVIDTSDFCHSSRLFARVRATLDRALDTPQDTCVTSKGCG